MMNTWFPRVTVGMILAGSLALALSAESRWVLPPETAKFKPGPGAEVLTGQCLLCHSADYVSTQPRLSRAAWAAIVQKMREKYGAPVPADQTNRIVEYLGLQYGK